MNPAQQAAMADLPSGPVNMSEWDPEFAYEYGLYSATGSGASPKSGKNWLQQNQTAVIGGAALLLFLALAAATSRR